MVSVALYCLLCIILQHSNIIFCCFWATVCKTVRPILSDRCLSVCLSCAVLSVLSVTLVYSGQTVGRIKMKLDMQVGLGLGHTVLDGDSGPLPPQGHIHTSANFGPYLLWRYGSIDQDAAWHGGRPRPRRHCVRWGPSSPPQKGVRALSNVLPMSIVAKRLRGSRCHLVGGWCSG